MESLKLHHDKKPWGEELWVTSPQNPPLKIPEFFPNDSDDSNDPNHSKRKKKPTFIKILTVNAEEALSLQYHKKREEYWHVVSGNGQAIVGEKEIAISPGSTCFIGKEIKHRLLADSSGPLIVLELSFGDIDADDIVRLEDKYGRIGSK